MLGIHVFLSIARTKMHFIMKIYKQIVQKKKIYKQVVQNHMYVCIYFHNCLIQIFIPFQNLDSIEPRSQKQSPAFCCVLKLQRQLEGPETRENVLPNSRAPSYNLNPFHKSQINEIFKRWVNLVACVYRIIKSSYNVNVSMMAWKQMHKIQKYQCYGRYYLKQYECKTHNTRGIVLIQEVLKIHCIRSALTGHSLFQDGGMRIYCHMSWREYIAMEFFYH